MSAPQQNPTPVNSSWKPADYIEGLKQNWQQDLASGFMVALLALPLSLGIAKASDFPDPLYGVLTAIIGGIIVSIFMGARLTIKGPAAGLIVIVAGAVSEFGGGEIGWHLTLGAIVAAGLVQMLFGFFKLGKLADFFPHAAIHGMLAAIGLVIISKQLHLMMGVNPVHAEGSYVGKPIVEPLELVTSLPETFHQFIATPTEHFSLVIGLICLGIIFSLQQPPFPFMKKIPAPLVVLAVAIPLGILFQLTPESGQLVKIGDFSNILGVNVSFEGAAMAGVFAKYVLLFAIIGSLESLLTAKAVDIMDPFRRKTNFDQDLMAVGAGNMLAGALGGLPMISEVARSSANVANGARTRWASFFHGVGLLLAVLLLAPLIKMIPVSALAAMLIAVGWKLAHPRELVHAYFTGREQAVSFLTTVFFTLTVDLLVGVCIGILTELAINIYRGQKIKDIFKSHVTVTQQTDMHVLVKISGSPTFSNYLGLKKHLDAIPEGKFVTIDLSECTLVGHTVMSNITVYASEYNEAPNSNCIIAGLDNHICKGKDALGAHVLKKTSS